MSGFVNELIEEHFFRKEAPPTHSADLGQGRSTRTPADFNDDDYEIIQEDIA